MKVLFAGPSFAGEARALAEAFPTFDIRPPAACGDLARAAADGAVAIGLVDGYFGSTAAVWHKEILFALARGVTVLGGSSMGALRAAECAAFGMIGIGSVFRDYAEGRLIDDEAVALVHGPAEIGYAPASVPWVNFEPTIHALARAGVITPRERDLVILTGLSTHFAARTYAGVLAATSSLDAATRSAALAWLAANAVDRKREDAWAVARALAEVGPSPVPDWAFAHTTQWDALARRLAGAEDAERVAVTD